MSYSPPTHIPTCTHIHTTSSRRVREARGPPPPAAARAHGRSIDQPHLNVARAGKKVPVLVERHRHDPIRHVERFLDAVAVVDINVNIQHARVVLEQLQDAQHNVVHVAEARPLGLFRVVQSARPVDGNVALAVIQATHCVQRAARVNLTKVEDAVKHGTVCQLAQVDWRQSRTDHSNGSRVEEQFIDRPNSNTIRRQSTLVSPASWFFLPLALYKSSLLCTRTLLELRDQILLITRADALQKVDIIRRVEVLDLLSRRNVRLLSKQKQRATWCPRDEHDRIFC